MVNYGSNLKLQLGLRLAFSNLAQVRGRVGEYGYLHGYGQFGHATIPGTYVILKAEQRYLASGEISFLVFYNKVSQKSILGKKSFLGCFRELSRSRNYSNCFHIDN